MATKQQLSALTKVTNGKVLPILGMVKFETGKLTATNLDLTIIIEDEEITQNGYVPGAKLKKSGLAAIQKHWGLVDETEFKAEDWPEIKALDTPHELNRATISGILDALVTVSHDDTRPVLTAIEIANNTVTSTDSYRLITRGTGHNISVLLPRQAAEIIKMTKLMDNWHIGYDKELITLRNGHFTLVSRLIEGTYPDWRKLQPKTAANRVMVKSELLFEALDLVENGNIRLEDNGGIYVTNGTKKSLVAVAKPDKNIELNPNYMHIVMPLKDSAGGVMLNDRYVRDAIGKAEYARFNFNGSLEPVVVEGIER